MLPTRTPLAPGEFRRVRVAAAAYLLLPLAAYLKVLPCARGIDQLLYLPAWITWLTSGIAVALVALPAPLAR